MPTQRCYFGQEAMKKRRLFFQGFCGTSRGKRQKIRQSVSKEYLKTKTIVAQIGRGGEIRTPDILLPKQARYQTALYPVQPEQQVPQQSWRAYYRRVSASSTTIWNFLQIIPPAANCRCQFLSFYHYTFHHYTLYLPTLLSATSATLSGRTLVTTISLSSILYYTRYHDTTTTPIPPQGAATLIAA